MLKLYYSPGACSLAPHILLEEANAEYVGELTTIAEGKTKTPEFLRINPKGRVPVLQIGEQVLTELPAISYFIAQTHPQAALFPSEPLASARCLEWFNWLSGTVHAVAFGQIWRPERFVNDATMYPSIKEKGHENIIQAFTAIERHLAAPENGNKRVWMVGDTVTVVDPFVLVLFRWGNRIGLNMRAAHPQWTQHAERMLTRPAVQRALDQENISIWR